MTSKYLAASLALIAGMTVFVVAAQAQTLSEVPGHPLPTTVRVGVATTLELLYRDPQGRAPGEATFDDGDGGGTFTGTVIGDDYQQGVIIKWSIIFNLPSGLFGIHDTGRFTVATPGNPSYLNIFFPSFGSHDYPFNRERASVSRPVLPTPRVLLGKWEGDASTYSLEFLSDGSLIFDHDISASYSILDGDRLKVVGPDGHVMMYSHVRVQAHEKISFVLSGTNDQGATVYYDGR